MQFSETTCFAQAQLRPVLCIWGVTPPAAPTSPAGALLAPAAPSHPAQLGGRGIGVPSLGAGLGTETAEK